MQQGENLNVLKSFSHLISFSPLSSLASHKWLWHIPACKHLSRCLKAPHSLAPPDTQSLFHKHYVPATLNYLVIGLWCHETHSFWLCPSLCGKSARKTASFQKDLSPSPPIYLGTSGFVLWNPCTKQSLQAPYSYYFWPMTKIQACLVSSFHIF